MLTICAQNSVKSAKVKSSSHQHPPPILTNILANIMSTIFPNGLEGEYDLGEGWLWSHTLVMKPPVIFSMDGREIRKREEYFQEHNKYS